MTGQQWERQKGHTPLLSIQGSAVQVRDPEGCHVKGSFQTEEGMGHPCQCRIVSSVREKQVRTWKEANDIQKDHCEGGNGTVVTSVPWDQRSARTSKSNRKRLFFYRVGEGDRNQKLCREMTHNGREEGPAVLTIPQRS